MPVTPVSDECRLDLTVTVPWATVKAFRDELISESMAGAKIPGFRRGKVPTGVFARHYEREILDAMRENFAPHHVLTEVSKKDLTFAHGPEIHDLRLVEGVGLEIDATVEVFPRFELGEYRNIEVSVPPSLPIDEVVDSRIRIMRIRHGSFANFDPRPARAGDHVLVSIEIAMEDGEPILQLSDQVIDLGGTDSLPSGFLEAIPGMSPGEETEFQYACSENLFARKVAGKTLRCKIQLHQVGMFELPDLDDEFAQDVSEDINTLDELMERVRAKAQADAEAQVEEDVQSQAMDVLAARHPMPLPSGYMARRTAQSIAAIEGNMAREEAGQEVTIDRLEYLTRELDPELTDAQVNQIAAVTAQTIRTEQVLERIAKLENISVSAEELDRRIRALAEGQKVRPDELTRHLVDSGHIHTVRMDLLHGKVADYVVGEAIRVPADIEDEPDDGGEEAVEVLPAPHHVVDVEGEPGDGDEGAESASS